PGRPRYSAANAEVAATCGQVLALAREEGWRVVHSQVRSPGTTPWPRELFGAPIEGLRPLISEPVYFRRGLSAFTDPGFAAELRAARGAEIYLIGFSLVDTCLATVLAGVDEGLSLTLVEDAVGASEALPAADVARAVLRPFVQFASSRRLMARRLEAVH
ncbi:MAG TPA: isochorismatase family protein, partial [Caulobacteraceae bacterium]|nr:isochorismatase family protein [Caulobacteraceae bacterium]